MKQVLNTSESRGTLVRELASGSAKLLEKPGEFFFGSQHHFATSKNPFVRAIGPLFYNTEGVAGKQGFLSVKDQETRKRMNSFTNAILGAAKDVEPADAQLALESMSKKETHADPKIAAIQKQLRGVLDDMHDYMEKAGVSNWNDEAQRWDLIKKLPNYFPRSWDTSYLSSNPARFKELMFANHDKELSAIAAKANGEVAKGTDGGEYTASWEKLQNPDGKAVTPNDVVDAILKRLLMADGMHDEVLQEAPNSLGYTPNMKAVNKRTLNWIDDKVFSEFMQKDMVHTMSTYISQGVKRAEYTKAFGPDGGKLQKLMDGAFHHEVDGIMKERHGVDGAMLMAKEAANAVVALHGAHGTWEEQLNRLAGGDEAGTKVITDAIKGLDTVKRAVMGMEGTLGHDISPLLRKINGYNVIYQNTRILGYSLFSNLIDPLGVVVRGGDFTDAYAVMKRGLTEVVRDWGDLTGLKKFDHNGRDEITRMSEAAGITDRAGGLSMMGNMYGSQYLSPRMRAWNDSFFRWNGMEGFNRGVREAATQVAIKFIKRHASEPNEHSSRYLKELDLTAIDVKAATSEEGGLNMDNPKISAAVMRWVDGAIVRPNASMRPIYGNDPHYASFFHLKQFMYATQATILKRMGHEAKNGNLDPLVIAMAGYIPVMLAADAMKGILQTAMGGGAPVWEHKGVAGMVAYGAQRAGLTGTAQMGLDLGEYGPAGLFGPAGEQVYHMFTDPWGESATKALAVGPAGLSLKGMAWND